LEWINQLKIAIIEKNEIKIEKLLEKFPQFSNIEEMKSAAVLMQEAHKFLTEKRDKYASNLIKIKKQKEYINYTSNKSSSFDQSH